MNVTLKSAIVWTRRPQKHIAQLAQMDESRLSQIINALERPASQKEQHRLLSVLRALLPEKDQADLTIEKLFPQTQETAQ